QRTSFLRVINGSSSIENEFGSASVPDYKTARVDGPGVGPSVQRIAGPGVSQTDEFERWALSRLVAKTSIELRGTEAGGGVAYYPYYYPYYYSPYSYYSYPAYAYPVYRSYSPYYYGSGYYGSNYYSSYSYSPYSSYYSTPSSTYWGGYYGGGNSSYGERYTWR